MLLYTSIGVSLAFAPAPHGHIGVSLAFAPAPLVTIE